MSDTGAGWKVWKIEGGGVCRCDCGAVGEEDGDTGSGWCAVVVWCCDVDVVASASGIGDAGGRSV